MRVYRYYIYKKKTKYFQNHVFPPPLPYIYTPKIKVKVKMKKHKKNTKFSQFH